MRVGTVLVLAAILAAPVAFGQEAEVALRRAEAERVFEAMNMRQQFANMESTLKHASSTIVAADSPVSPRARDIAQEELLAALKDMYFRPGGMKDLTVRTIAERFTVDELRQIREFHESPVARKLLTEQVRMNQDLIPELMQFQRDLLVFACKRIDLRLKIEAPESVHPMPQCRGVT